MSSQLGYEMQNTILKCNVKSGLNVFLLFLLFICSICSNFLSMTTCEYVDVYDYFL